MPPKLKSHFEVTTNNSKSSLPPEQKQLHKRRGISPHRGHVRARRRRRGGRGLRGRQHQDAQAGKLSSYSH